METILWSISVSLAWLGGMFFWRTTGGSHKNTKVADSASANNVSPKFPACKEVIDHVDTAYGPLTVREQWCISRAWDFIGGKLRA